MKNIRTGSNNSSSIVRLVDLENLCGGSSQIGRLAHPARLLFDRYESRHQGLTYVAIGRRSVELAPELLWDWRDSRVMIGRGRDGADRRLLEVVEHEITKEGLTLHVWSGDHCFAPAVKQAIASGSRVTVFSRPGSVASELLDSGAKIMEISLTGASRVPHSSRRHSL